MIGEARSQRAVIFALALSERHIVDACETLAHQAVLVEFPVFI
jgi:hypothetical protein